jgi:dTDP-4-dehydrorhamnose reductase
MTMMRLLLVAISLIQALIVGGISTSPEKPIVVLGAGGKTGRIISQILADQNHHVRAVTRTPDINLATSQKDYVSHVTADVREYDQIQSAVEGAAGVVWAATCTGVKRGGGDALQVDYRGAYYTAKACLACNVPKLAFISAGCVTRPNSLGSRIVNTLTQFTYGKELVWTDSKLAGEIAVRDLYRAASKTKRNRMAYVIVRPAAALSNKPPVQVEDLLVMQGDVYSSAESISRTNVAQVVVQALLKGKTTDFCTFEVCPAVKLYKNEEGNMLDVIGLPTKKQTTIPDLPKALVHRNAPSYGELLEGLVTDEGMMKNFGSIISDYRLEGLPSMKDTVALY